MPNNMGRVKVTNIPVNGNLWVGEKVFITMPDGCEMALEFGAFTSRGRNDSYIGKSMGRRGILSISLGNRPTIWRIPLTEETLSAILSAIDTTVRYIREVDNNA